MSTYCDVLKNKLEKQDSGVVIHLMQDGGTNPNVPHNLRVWDTNLPVYQSMSKKLLSNH